MLNALFIVSAKTFQNSDNSQTPKAKPMSHEELFGPMRLLFLGKHLCAMLASRWAGQDLLLQTNKEKAS